MIEVQGLRKEFGAFPVLKAIDFHVPAGALCGFIGPNGAGKTTTMRILATLELPSAGSARIGGLDVVKDALQVRRTMGYMPDYYGTYSNLNTNEYVDFFARAHRLPGGLRSQRAQDVIAFTELTELLPRPVEGLSKGQKQRLNLARALLPDPQLLVLDEPAAGLDPRARIELRELLKLLASRGKTVFISSHILSELADLIDWLVIIDHGRVRHCGPPDTPSAGAEAGLQLSTYVFELACEPAGARKFLLEQPGVHSAEAGDDMLVLALDEQVEKIEELIARMVGAGLRFRQVQRRQADLEDVFLRATSRRSDAPTG
ncbi:MAG TPA: ABC transporter ATP-binding protein [Polyangiales bacterium]|nr:ABC transporter ATP-binding protein [Polyangiales bacterium]